MSKTNTRTSFRLDIQGLRAIAVGLVVIYHLHPASLTGGFVGVDVFFVISGYLITSHLVRHPPRTPKEFGGFWLRRIKRLLPASILVLLTTVIAVRALAPPSFWRENTFQAIASAFYSQNWYLLATSVDYLAEDNAPTAVQHYWSLAVEEQFYLLWPLCIAALWWFAVRKELIPKRVVSLGVLSIVVTSLGYSIYLTSVDPGVAYFSTFTRAWELALGALVALAPAPQYRISSSWVGAAIAWTGLAGIVGAGIAYDSTTPFPGYEAGLPVLGSALVIWIAATSRFSPNWLLSSRPFQFLGGHSYSIYLWHWPVIVLLPFVSGTLGVLDLLAATVAILILSMLSKRYVEDAFRKTLDVSRIVTPLRFLVIGTATVALLAGGIAGEAKIREQSTSVTLSAALDGTVPCFGGAALLDLNDGCQYDANSELLLSPALAKNDKSQAYADECWSSAPFEKKPTCTYGTGKNKVALVGNSHAGHWLPALQKIAVDKDWTITTFLVDRCNPTDAMLKFDAEIKSRGCEAYGKWVMDQTSHGEFDLIITSERQSIPVVNHSFATTEDPARVGYESYLNRWTASNTPILIIRDTPFPGATLKNIPDCVATATDANAECSGSAEEWEWMDPLVAAAERAPHENVAVIDPTRYFCQDGTCPAVIGGVVVYFDASHITATYASTLAAFLEADLDKALKKISG
ncbi:acyltransferase family protein [Paeniglutamicibacter psychrophenolicus]|uniref:acyltransferase family protein n=1 Tax=Paeniglutamicibacter psychrophenolicus TaxID=257454 RepID=UPI0027888ED2|nr:acyltransferase family protein [Paeniglutamicibacter psychrophenolicus]MDQ0095905.1 peptidoglycan/LPS O-acetylase OafA/YrhL [Paeniglutamicibacter psychrophenolicus]